MGRTRADARLLRIQRLAQANQYRLSVHVREKIEDGEFYLQDIEHAIASGSIVESQKDDLCQSSDGRKYTIRGYDLCGAAFEVIGKIVVDHEGDTFLVITAFNRRGG